MTGIVILAGARTAIGTFGGALSGVAPCDLATIAAKAALARSGVAPEQIGQVVFGHVLNTEPRDMYVSRVTAVRAENVVAACDVTRVDQDTFAAESQRRLAAAITAGRFADEITSVEFMTQKGPEVFDIDEPPKPPRLTNLLR